MLPGFISDIFQVKTQDPIFVMNYVIFHSINFSQNMAPGAQLFNRQII